MLMEVLCRYGESDLHICYPYCGKFSLYHDMKALRYKELTRRRFLETGRTWTLLLTSFHTAGAVTWSQVAAGSTCKNTTRENPYVSLLTQKPSWLNEGWTMYLERRIIADIHGPAHFDFSAVIGWQDLGGFSSI